MIRPQFLINCGFAVSPLLLLLDSETVPLRVVVAIAALVLFLFLAGYLLLLWRIHRRNVFLDLADACYAALICLLAVFIAWCTLPLFRAEAEMEER